MRKLLAALDWRAGLLIAMAAVLLSVLWLALKLEQLWLTLRGKRTSERDYKL